MNICSLFLYQTLAHYNMSPRIKRLRKMLNPPAVKGFKPYGPGIDSKNSETVNLLYEEYEALRLCDYDMYNHLEASAIMNVSRPTFTRIYASARQKIAKAFVDGCKIAVEGGKVYFDSDWHICNNCNCYFNNPEKDKELTNCPLCKSENISNYDTEPEYTETEITSCNTHRHRKGKKNCINIK